MCARRANASRCGLVHGHECYGRHHILHVLISNLSYSSVDISCSQEISLSQRVPGTSLGQGLALKRLTY